MPIQVLPSHITNQIAAGEVVERPASVVKELLENSLDAGATCIDIDIERGGTKFIRIRDNGIGIKKDELSLAIARHATSKITSLDDLESIVSLGFRGEALAHISSVSRLTLISRTADQQEAWKIYAEGGKTEERINPVAHPTGTTLDVLDLFYNTPVRRKFMRTEKTEFEHIDEIIRRIALARFDITINLSHNSKIIRQYRAITKDWKKNQRLAVLCGKTFLEHAKEIECKQSDLFLFGWIANLSFKNKTANKIQYCYINNRTVRNRLINHAVRQACAEKIGVDQYLAFILYLNIDPHQVDVNVHPAKHEVRFQNSRLVHDFIYQGLLRVLSNQNKPILIMNDKSYTPESNFTGGKKYNQFYHPSLHHSLRRNALFSSAKKYSHDISISDFKKQQGLLYNKLLSTPEPTRILKGYYSQSFGQFLTVVESDMMLLKRDDGLALLSLPIAEIYLKQAQLIHREKSSSCSYPLLIPICLKITAEETELLTCAQHLLLKIGIKIDIKLQCVILREVPLLLRQQNLHNLIPKLIAYLSNQKKINVSESDIAYWIAWHIFHDQKIWNMVEASKILINLEDICPRLAKSPPDNLLQPIDLQIAINALKKNEKYQYDWSA